MHINQDAYSHYWEKGWVAIEDVYSPNEVERIAQIAIEVPQKLRIRESVTPLIERKMARLHREKSMRLSSKNLTFNPSS